jgi:hypothetical protein
MNDLDADYTPRYIWLAKLLRGWIEDGTYPPGSPLPSSSRLAAMHSMSRATALHTLAVLPKSGHVRHVDSKPHQVIWRPTATATMQASFPGSAAGPQSLPALRPPQDLQHRREAFDQRGKLCLSFLRGSQRGSAYLRFAFIEPGSEQMAPVICHTTLAPRPRRGNPYPVTRRVRRRRRPRAVCPQGHARHRSQRRHQVSCRLPRLPAPASSTGPAVTPRPMARR